MTQNQDYVEAGKVSEITNGHMKHVEINGKKIGEPVLEIPPGMEPLPPSWQKYMEIVGQQMSFIKTYDQDTYEVKVEGDTIKIKA